MTKIMFQKIQNIQNIQNILLGYIKTLQPLINMNAILVCKLLKKKVAYLFDASLQYCDKFRLQFGFPFLLIFQVLIIYPMHPIKVHITAIHTTTRIYRRYAFSVKIQSYEDFWENDWKDYVNHYNW